MDGKQIVFGNKSQDYYSGLYYTKVIRLVYWRRYKAYIKIVNNIYAHVHSLQNLDLDD